MNMSMEQKIQRINELYHKSKKEGLTEAEKMEQQNLRKDYVNSIRNNLKTQLEHISIQNPDGTIVRVEKKHKDKEK